MAFLSVEVHLVFSTSAGPMSSMQKILLPASIEVHGKWCLLIEAGLAVYAEGLFGGSQILLVVSSDIDTDLKDTPSWVMANTTTGFGDLDTHVAQLIKNTADEL